MCKTVTPTGKLALPLCARIQELPSGTPKSYWSPYSIRPVMQMRISLCFIYRLPWSSYFLLWIFSFTSVLNALNFCKAWPALCCVYLSAVLKQLSFSPPPAIPLVPFLPPLSLSLARWWRGAMLVTYSSFSHFFRLFFLPSDYCYPWVEWVRPAQRQHRASKGRKRGGQRAKQASKQLAAQGSLLQAFNIAAFGLCAGRVPFAGIPCLLLGDGQAHLQALLPAVPQWPGAGRPHALPCHGRVGCSVPLAAVAAAAIAAALPGLYLVDRDGWQAGGAAEATTDAVRCTRRHQEKVRRLPWILLRR